MCASDKGSDDSKHVRYGQNVVVLTDHLLLPLLHSGFQIFSYKPLGQLCQPCCYFPIPITLGSYDMGRHVPIKSRSNILRCARTGVSKPAFAFKAHKDAFKHTQRALRLTAGGSSAHPYCK